MTKDQLLESKAVAMVLLNYNIKNLLTSQLLFCGFNRHGVMQF